MIDGIDLFLKGNQDGMVCVHFFKAVRFLNTYIFSIHYNLVDQISLTWGDCIILVCTKVYFCISGPGNGPPASPVIPVSLSKIRV